VLRSLSAGLGLEGERKAQFDAVVEEETQRLLEVVQAEAARIDVALKGADRGAAPADADSMRAIVQEAMSELRAGTSAMLARNRAANARVLETAVQIAGVDERHPVIAEATVELDLLALIGSRGLGQRAGRRELEGFAGVTVECYSNPFAVARLMDAADGERDAAAALVASHGDELIEAAKATREAMLDNVGGFLKLITSRERGREFGLPPWQPKVAAPQAVELRFKIVDEIGAVLGPDAARAYERCWRRLERPALERPRAAAVTRVQGVIERAGVDPVLETALRAALAASDGTRDAAVRATHLWRANTVVGERLESPDQWRIAIFGEPLGAYLYSRIADADDRGLATCEVLAAMAESTDALADAVRISERPIVKTMRPWWP
jgi:hypothetical protein